MTVDPDIVHHRLRSMHDLLTDLDGIGVVTVERLEQDRIVRHATERIMTQLVDLAVSINSHVIAASGEAVPGTYRASFAVAAAIGAISAELATELAPSAGLRNILTHEYVAVDLELVARAVPAAHDAYRRYVAEVARFVEGLPDR